MQDVLTKFRTELKDVRGCADATVDAYIRESSVYCDYLGARGKTVLTASRDDIIEFKKDQDHRKPRGLRLVMSIIKNFHAFLDDQNLLRPSPFPATLTVRVKDQDSADVPTIEQFLEMRRRVEIPVNDKRAVPMVARRAMMEFLAGAGLRIDALLTVCPMHLRFGSRPIIMVDPETMACKGKHAGEIPIAPYAAELIRKYLAEHSCPLDRPIFTYSDSVVRKILNQCAPKGLSVHPHSLRHFFCSMTYFRNFDGTRNDAVWVRDAAGHGSISTTDNYLKMARRVCRVDSLWETWAHGAPLAVRVEKIA